MSSGKYRNLTLAALLALSWAMPSQAVVYQWVDENGTKAFSQNPPLDTPYKVIAPNNPTPPENIEKAKTRLKLLIQRQNESQKEREKHLYEQQERAAEQKLRQRQCQQARKHLGRLQDRPRVRVTDDDGSVRRINEEERQEKMRQASTLIGNVCRK